MESEKKQSAKRILWIAVLLAVFALGLGGYYWYEQVTVRYDRITNATRV